MAKKKRKYYSGKELLYRRQLERKQPGYWLGKTENEGGKEQ